MRLHLKRHPKTLLRTLMNTNRLRHLHKVLHPDLLLNLLRNPLPQFQNLLNQ